jgi:carbamoyl-phosphate synthase small subunit
MSMTRTSALLVLDDGACFEGRAYGAKGEASGEVVFATSMTGYQETLSDPSYCGQIVTFTAAHIGNYGVTPQDRQSDRLFVGGAVVHDLFTPDDGPFPHWRAAASFDHSMAAAGLTVIGGVDTRALTLHLRDNGARNGIISALDLDRESLLRRARALPPMSGLDLTGQVTCPAPYLYEDAPLPEAGKPAFRVAVYDFGVKRSILNRLRLTGIEPTVWPADTPAATVLASQPDGVVLSNGPGDPGACGRAIATAKNLLGRTPLFGICLGHQILGLALGAATYKLKFGHHGANQPVKDLDSGRVLVTSQNHGFCVDPDSLPRNARITHWNVNDDTLEGFACGDLPAFGVQFHPEAGPGPSDAAPLFARFRELMAANRLTPF